MLGRIATLLVLFPLLAFSQSPRFTLETFPVSGEGLRGPLSIMFRLDTASGTVWRVVRDRFEPVSVAGLTNRPSREEANAVLENLRRREATFRKMQALIIPDINFRQADIRTVFKVLSEQAKELDPEKTGVTFVLSLGGMESRMSVMTDPFGSPTNACSVTNYSSGIPEITFTAKFISLAQAVKIVTSVAGLSYRLDGDSVVVTPYSSIEGQIEYAWFEISPVMLDWILLPGPMTQGESPPAQGPAAEAEDRLKIILGWMGVIWPQGSFLKLDLDHGTLQVANVPKFLNIIEERLEGFNLIAVRPGRFQLKAGSFDGRPGVLLIDSRTGRTWRYEIRMINKDQKTIESDWFAPLH